MSAGGSGGCFEDVSFGGHCLPLQRVMGEVVLHEPGCHYLRSRDIETLKLEEGFFQMFHLATSTIYSHARHSIDEVQ